MATVFVFAGLIRNMTALDAEPAATRFSRRRKRRADASDIRALGAHVGFSSGGRSPPEPLLSPD